jgi:hypothetical protein
MKKPKVLQKISFYYYSDVYISYYIQSKETLLKIAENLSFKPDIYYNKNDIYIGKQINIETKKVEKVSRKRYQSIIEFTTRKKIKSKNINDHANYLLEILKKDSSLINKVNKKESYNTGIDIHLLAKDIPHGFFMNSKLLNNLLQYSKSIEIRFQDKICW